MAYFRDVVGIDVSKQNLDLYVLSGQQRRTVANTAAGYGDLVSWLKSLGVRMAVMEASGGYERDVAKALRQAGFDVRIVDPKRVRHFAKAAGRLSYRRRDDCRVWRRVRGRAAMRDSPRCQARAFGGPRRGPAGPDRSSDFAAEPDLRLPERSGAAGLGGGFEADPGFDQTARSLDRQGHCGAPAVRRAGRPARYRAGRGPGDDCRPHCLAARARPARPPRAGGLGGGSSVR